MGATSIEERGASRSVLGAESVAYIGAGAFASAAAWYALAFTGIAVAPRPRFGTDVPLLQRMDIFYRWVVTTLPQERAYTIIAIVGFVCSIATVLALHDRLAGASAMGSVGLLAFVGGAGLWVVGNVAQLGGHAAVGSMVTAADSTRLPTLSAIYFTVDTVDDAFEIAAFSALACGLLVFALVGTRSQTVPRAWRTTTILLALSLFGTVIAYAAGTGDLVDDLLFIGGFLLFPTWLVWCARLIGDARS